MSIIQIVVLFIFKNYYVFFSINLAFTAIECVLIHIWANKLFPDINGKSKPLDKNTKKEISKNVVALSMHKIGGAVVFSTDNILISSLIGLTVLGIYSNYYLIITGIISIFGLFSNAIIASVGNLIASCDKEYVYTKFKLINFLFSYFSIFTTICLCVLFQSFIKIWIGSKYMLSNISVVLLCFSFYLTRMRTATNIFKDTAGLFWQNRWMPIAEAVVNLVASIVLGHFMGINGIILGTIISTLVAPFWVEPLILYKHYFKKSTKSYYINYLLNTLIMLSGAVITYFVCNLIPDGSIGLFILKMLVCLILSNSILLISYSPNKEFKECSLIIKNFIKGLFKKSNYNITKK